VAEYGASKWITTIKSSAAARRSSRPPFVELDNGQWANVWAENFTDKPEFNA
jgi:hypothetical protein